jgi:hypothetical protein
MCQVSDKIWIWPKSIFFLNSIFSEKVGNSKKSSEALTVQNGEIENREGFGIRSAPLQGQPNSSSILVDRPSVLCFSCFMLSLCIVEKTSVSHKAAVDVSGSFYFPHMKYGKY